MWLIALEALGEEVTCGFLSASLKCGCPGLVSLGHWAKCKWSNQIGQTVRLKRLFFLFFHFSCHLSHLLTIFFQINIKLSSADQCCLPNKGHSPFSSPVCFIMLRIHLVDRNVLSFLKGSVWLKGGVPDLMHESWTCSDIWWGSLLLVSVQFWAQMESTGLYIYLKCNIQDRKICILFIFVMKPPHLKAQSSNTTISLLSFPPSFLYSCTVQQLSSNCCSFLKMQLEQIVLSLTFSLSHYSFLTWHSVQVLLRVAHQQKQAQTFLLEPKPLVAVLLALKQVSAQKVQCHRWARLKEDFVSFASGKFSV